MNECDAIQAVTREQTRKFGPDPIRPFCMRIPFFPGMFIGFAPGSVDLIHQVIRSMPTPQPDCEVGE